MFAVFIPLTALLAGVALLLTGGGLLGTLLAVRGSIAGFGDQTLGLIMSCYFAGFLAGTFVGPPAIQRMGHIRTFAFFAALAACAVMTHPVFVDPWIWGLLRFVTGVALVVLFTVIESWLNATADGAQRGRVFAIYMAVTLLALALGQQLLRLAPAESFALFSLVAMLICMAMMPVTATRLGQPQVQMYRRIGPRRLYGIAPAAAGGALVSGLVMGAFWGLGPVYAARMGLAMDQVATFMTAAILGGALLQWPIGRLSDSGDRRTTLAVICTLAAVVAGYAVLLTQASAGHLYAVFFLFGGLSFAIYPLTVAHLLDHLPAESVLPACSTVLLVHGFGAAMGPTLAGAVMHQFGPRALPGYLVAVNLLLAGFVAYRIAARSRVKSQSDAHFHAMLRTTPTAMELLPETETGSAKE